MKRLYEICVVLACVCVFFQLATANNSGTANDDPVPVVTRHVLEKDNLTLVCNATETADLADFYWIKNGTRGKSSEFYASGRRLEFLEISKEASAVYSCRALDNRTGENVTVMAVKVDVQYPAEIRNMTLDPRTIMSNESFGIGCSLYGSPEPIWSIYNNDTGRVLLSLNYSETAFLSGFPVYCGDSGTWLCSGYNVLNQGVNVTRGIHLTVLCSPRPDPDSTSTYTYQSSLGDTVAMRLNVKGDPVITYTWSRDDDRAFGNIHIETGPEGTTLQISDLDVNDFGNYTLNMNNSMGSYEAHFSLHAHGAPVKPYNLSVSNIECSSADLSWISGYDMGSREEFIIMHGIDGGGFIQWSNEISGPYENGGLGQQWTYHMTRLECDTEYEFGVLARNADNVSFSDPVTFNTTSTNEPEDHSHHVHIAVIISCSVAGTFILVLLLVALSRRRSRKHRFAGRDSFGQSMKSQYGSSMKSDYGSTVDGKQGNGYPKIVYKRDDFTDSTNSNS